ncbi:hypothetical protein FGO68_gene8560 [Halteria grandinella]|uniref:Uncharacterized protein n=1 Tax=Halteria grandinella TaxID=5974 RepID=A0A8J8NV22_HALGN|nr:hypothetical protein FGO68_gene8560 [Halteria grandinella]
MGSFWALIFLRQFFVSAEFQITLKICISSFFSTAILFSSKSSVTSSKSKKPERSLSKSSNNFSTSLHRCISSEVYKQRSWACSEWRRRSQWRVEQEARLECTLDQWAVQGFQSKEECLLSNEDLQE